MRHLIIGLTAASSLLGAPPIEISDDESVPLAEDSSSSWSVDISAGPSWRHFGSVKMRTVSRSQQATLNSQIGSSSLTLPPIGDETSYADRDYNDGYVYQDAGTSTTGLTWYWGYDNNSQVQNGSLFFSATGSRSVYSDSSSYSGVSYSEENMEDIGYHLDVTITPPETSNLPFKNLLLSFTYFSDEQESEYSTFSGGQVREDYRLDFVDRYDLDGVIPPLAPYRGTFVGPGPFIENKPDARNRTDVLTGTTTASIENTIHTSLDMDVFSLALAPSLTGTFEEGLTWQLSAGPTFNVFHFDGSQNEVLAASVDGGSVSTLSEWKESNSATKLRLGFMGRASVGTVFESGWSFDFHLQAEWVDNVDFNVGPSTYSLDPVGYSFGFGIGRSF